MPLEACHEREAALRADLKNSKASEVQRCVKASFGMLGLARMSLVEAELRLEVTSKEEEASL